jgi:hypothetical protein
LGSERKQIIQGLSNKPIALNYFPKKTLKVTAKTLLLPSIFKIK